MQLIVLGMHRSGTSVLTHLLAAMGCQAGPPESLQAGDAANPQGYWESRAAWALDEEALAALGASWWEVADLDLAALDAAQRESFTARARAIVGELDTLAAQRPSVLKEPRMCVLLPLWRPALDAPAFAFVHRDPLEVARSLQARDGFPVAVGLALWEVYTLAALRHSLGAPRVAASYRRLLSDPEAVAAELLARLEPLAPGALRVPSADELAQVVRTDLHRQRAEAGEAAGYLTAAQQRLAAAYADGSALSWSEVPAPSPGALELLRWFAVAEGERRALPDLRHRVESAEAEASWRRGRDADLVRWNADLRAAVAAAEPEIRRLQERVAEVSRYNEDLAPRLAAAEEELGRLRQRDAEISQWNETLTARLAAADQAAATRLAEAARQYAESQRRFDELHGLLRDAVAHAEQSGELVSALDRLVGEILASRTWRAGRAAALPLRWRHGREPGAQHRHDEMHAEAEALAARRRDLVGRATQGRGGPQSPEPGDVPESTELAKPTQSAEPTALAEPTTPLQPSGEAGE